VSAQPHYFHPRAGSDDANTAARSPLALLVYRARDGDPAAWDDIVDRFAGMVWAIARRYGLSEADAANVSRTTWLRLVEHLDRIEDPERIGGWLASTARHESLHVLRTSDRAVPADDAADMRSSDIPGVAAAVLGDESALWELVSLLSPRCQLLLTVFGVESPLSDIEIGQALHLPTASIEPTRRCCLEHLRRLAATRAIHAPPNVA
jgi:DNA-directed RNA polymerase specialized sigma24 family protein